MKSPEKIAKALHLCYNPPSSCDDCPYCDIGDCTACVAKDAEACIRSLVDKVPRWISVEERLPEICKHVIVFKQRKAIGGMAAPWWHIETDWRGEDDWSKNPGECCYVITHWMPLPEPPKEE